MTPEERVLDIKRRGNEYMRGETLLCACGKKALCVIFTDRDGKRYARTTSYALPVDADEAVRHMTQCRRCGRGCMFVVGVGEIGVLHLDPPTYGAIAD